MKKLLFASLVLAVNTTASADATRDGYYSWTNAEAAHAEMLQKSAAPPRELPADMKGWEFAQTSFMDKWRANLSSRNIPERVHNYTPWGWNEFDYRNARSKAYLDARVDWEKEFRQESRARAQGENSAAAHNEYERSKPESQKIREAYRSTGPRPPGLTVLGYGADPGSPLEKTVRVMFGTQQVAVSGSDQRKNVIVTEGSLADLKSVMDLIAKHPSDKKLMITLGLGFASATKGADGSSGVRAATSLAKFFASNPELIATLKAKGINFQVFDERARAGWGTLDSYLESDDWKKRNRAIVEAKRQIDSTEFKAKLSKIDELEKEMKKAKSKAAYETIAEQISKIRGETNVTMGRAYAHEVVTDAILEMANPKGIKNSKVSEVAEIMVTRVNENIAAEVGVKDTRSSGSKVDPAKAAKAARVAK